MSVTYAIDTTFGHEGLLPLPLPDAWPAVPVPGSPLLMDEKVVICSRSDTEVRLLKLDQAGAIDTTFGHQGHLKVQVAAIAAHLARVPGGRLLLTTLSVAGRGQVGELAVTLLHEDGTCVESFGHDGHARFNVGPIGDLAALRLPSLTSLAEGDGFVIGLSCQPDGAAQWHARVIRLNGKGQAEFALNGKPEQFQYPGMHTVLTDIGALPDGKILACGVRWADGDGRRQGFLARLSRNGQLDASFGQGGFAGLRGIGRDNLCARLSPTLPHGGRWLVGVSATGGNRGSLLTVTALERDGSPQPGYAGLLPVESTNVQIAALHLGADGRALILGHDASATAGKGTFVAGLLPSGRFDGQWGHGAAIQWFEAARPQTPSVQPDGSLLMLSPDRPGEPTIRRLRVHREPATDARQRLPSDGVLDPDWGGDGSVPLAEFYFLPLVSLEPRAEDQRVLVGAAFANVAHLQRWTSRAIPDDSFGDEQGESILVVLPVDDDTSLVLGDLITLPDQRILVLAHATNGNDFAHPLVARLLPDGTLDTQFGDAGIRLVTEIDLFAGGGPGAWYGKPPTPRAVVLADGSVVFAFANPHDVNAVDQLMVIKLNPQGQLDNDFGEKGICALRYQGRPTASVAIALQDDDRLLVAGSVDGKALFCRLQRNGTLDETFGEQGFTVIDGSSQGAGQLQVHDLAVSPIDGSVLGTGHLHRQPGAVAGPQGMLIRLLADGSLHPTFNNQRLLSLYLPSSNGPVPCNLLRSDFDARGLILVAGNTEPVPNMMLARLMPHNGSPDPSFGDGGFIFTPKRDDEPFEEAGSHALQQDGKILLIVNSHEQQIRLRRYLPNAAVPTPRAAWQGFAQWLRQHWGRVSKLS